MPTYGIIEDAQLGLATESEAIRGSLFGVMNAAQLAGYPADRRQEIHRGLEQLARQRHGAAERGT